MSDRCVSMWNSCVIAGAKISTILHIQVLSLATIATAVTVIRTCKRVVGKQRWYTIVPTRRGDVTSCITVQCNLGNAQIKLLMIEIKFSSCTGNDLFKRVDHAIVIFSASAGISSTLIPSSRSCSTVNCGCRSCSALAVNVIFSVKPSFYSARYQPDKFTVVVHIF